MLYVAVFANYSPVSSKPLTLSSQNKLVRGISSLHGITTNFLLYDIFSREGLFMLTNKNVYMFRIVLKYVKILGYTNADCKNNSKKEKSSLNIESLIFL